MMLYIDVIDCNLYYKCEYICNTSVNSLRNQVVVIYVCLVNSVVGHVVSHVLATVADDPALVDRFMFRVYGLSEYLLKYVLLTLSCQNGLHLTSRQSNFIYSFIHYSYLS